MGPRQLRMMRYVVVPALLLIAGATLFVVQCAGPDPRVERIELTPPGQPGHPYQVEVEVRNDSWGHGELTVIFELRDRASGATFQSEKQVNIEARQSIRVVGEINAPQGEYEASARAVYPPQ